MTSIELIAAAGRDRCIGRNGQLPFHIPDDLRRFRAMTMGKPVVMGRKTWISLPRKPLPGRLNIVLSRGGGAGEYGEALLAGTPAQALALAGGAPVVMIIGGGEVYSAFMPMARRIHLTAVDAAVPGGDAFMPDFQTSGEWTLASESAGSPTPSGEGVSYQEWLRT